MQLHIVTVVAPDLELYRTFWTSCKKIYFPPYKDTQSKHQKKNIN